MVAAKDTIETELTRLESRADELMTVCHQLRAENRSLMERLDRVNTERASLVRKNEQTRGRVEAMIGRLRTLEHNV